MPTEAEPWQPVDVSDVEEKLRKLSTTPVEAKAEAPPSPPPPTGGGGLWIRAGGAFTQEASGLYHFCFTHLYPFCGRLYVWCSIGFQKRLYMKSPRTLPQLMHLPDSTSKETLPVKTNPQPKGPPEVKAPPPAKAPPAGAQAQMEDLLKLRPFLRFGGDVDSDVAMAKSGFTPPPRSSSLPKSSLKPRSKSKASSRAASKEPERSHTPKRGAKSPPRQEEPAVQHKRKKTVGAISSCYFTGYTPSDIAPSVYHFDEMPRDLYARIWKRDFLAWMARDLKKSWPFDSRAFVNLHVGLYMYDPSAKYPVAHPRAFAACSLAGDASLYERFCCWTCRKQVEEGEVKSLWEDMHSFTQHWHVDHASTLNTDWTTLALYGGITIQDLAWEILGVDLEEMPLPRHAAALRVIPKVMPHKRGRSQSKDLRLPLVCAAANCATYVVLYLQSHTRRPATCFQH